MLPATGDEGRKDAGHLQSLSSVSRPRCVVEDSPREAARRLGQRSTHSRAFRQARGLPHSGCQPGQLPCGIPRRCSAMLRNQREAVREHRNRNSRSHSWPPPRCSRAAWTHFAIMSRRPSGTHLHRPRSVLKTPTLEEMNRHVGVWAKPTPPRVSASSLTVACFSSLLRSPAVRRGVGRRPAASDDGGNKDTGRQSQNHQIAENGRKETKARRKTTAGHAAYCSQKRLPREGGQSGANDKQRVGKE